MVVCHTLIGQRRIFPSHRHGLFFNFNLNLMVGSDSGLETLFASMEEKTCSKSKVYYIKFIK
jgi:hypothetical protein